VQTAEPQKQHQKNFHSSRHYSALFVCVAAMLTLVIGFVAGTRSTELAGLLGPQFMKTTSLGGSSLDLSSTQETYRILQQKYDGKLDEGTLAQFASKGLAQATGDPYTQYFTAKEAAELDNDLSGKIGGGIGAELGKRNDRITVIRPLKGSPAEAAGMQMGDVIAKVNDEDMSGKTVEEVVKRIRGEVATTVKVVVVRAGELKEMTITRAEITAPDVESRRDGDVGVIKISRFDKETGAKARAAAEDLKRQGVKGIVLDLRGNPGGYLESGVDVASIWLQSGATVVSQRRGDTVTDELKVSGSPVLSGMPTTILIDAGSASASEIVAGALHDAGVATLIGEKSFGKGSVQELKKLSNGDELKVTVAKWYTPKGKNISKEGIRPDTEVKMSQDDVNNNRDPQLEAAMGKIRG
jgi:carboxyl-terminal processing protease